MIELPEEIKAPFVLRMEKELLKGSVGAQMFCSCGKVLDCRSATLIQTIKGSGCFCPDCAAKLSEKVIDALRVRAKEDPEHFTLLIGSELFAKSKKK